jgi:hypothetical protein
LELFQIIKSKRKHDEAMKCEFNLLGEKVQMKHVQKIVVKCVEKRVKGNHNQMSQQ